MSALPNFTDQDMSGAKPLSFSPYSPNDPNVGWDMQAFDDTNEPNALLNQYYSFTGIKGAIYDIFSTSWFDPFILMISNANGEVIAWDQDDGPYGTDIVFNFVAPYTGTYYLAASWNQGSYYRHCSVSVYEDVDIATPVAPPAPPVTPAAPTLPADALPTTPVPNTPVAPPIPPIGANASIRGTKGNDTIQGTAKTDHISSGDGNDTITAGGGNDLIRGGLGADTLVIEGNSTDYTIVGEPLCLTVAGPEGDYYTTSVEYIKFDDKTVDVLFLYDYGPHPRTVNGFDATYYTLTNPDVAAAETDPLTHFNLFGWKEGRNPNPLFDTAWYLEHNPDVAASGMNPLTHYVLYGWKELRDPSPMFDTSDYLGLNPDVAIVGMNPMVHYLDYGSAENENRPVGIV